MPGSKGTGRARLFEGDWSQIMTSELAVLLWTAGTVGLIHTLLGPDHYVPFVAMSGALRWSRAKTIWITAICGLGHVLSSVVLGFLGIGLGVAVTRLGAWESYRGNLAAWFLIAFGLVYFIWGVRRAIRNQPHTHLHGHEHGVVHAHTHAHQGEHVHVHGAEDRGIKSVTPWVLFTIFVFGPCEPLIPLVMYPAAKHSLTGVVLVTIVFGVVTIAAMLGAVLAIRAGLTRLSFASLERYTHALAGATILICGLAIRFLGL
jgi:nickel/cobalt exporter